MHIVLLGDVRGRRIGHCRKKRTGAPARIDLLTRPRYRPRSPRKLRNALYGTCAMPGNH